MFRPSERSRLWIVLFPDRMIAGHGFGDLQLINDPNISFGRVQRFLRVAEAGTVAKAIKGSSGQQPQLSKELKQLSEWAGAELFQRSGRNKVLTAEGQELQRLLIEQLKALCEFRQRIKKMPIT